jgi:hypothetical protein
MTWRISNVLRRRPSKDVPEAKQHQSNPDLRFTIAGRHWSLDTAWQGDKDKAVCSVEGCMLPAAGLAFYIVVEVFDSVGSAEMNLLCDLHATELTERPPWSYKHDSQLLRINGFVSWLPEPFIWMPSPPGHAGGTGTESSPGPPDRPRPKRFRS